MTLSHRRRLIALAMLACATLSGCWGKSAFRMCGPHITLYPFVPSASCQFLHMCANEAVLSDDEYAKLLRIIADTPGCQPP